MIISLGGGLSVGPAASVLRGVGCLGGYQDAREEYVCVCRCMRAPEFSGGWLGHWGLHLHGKHPFREYIQNNKFTEVAFVHIDIINKKVQLSPRITKYK